MGCSQCFVQEKRKQSEQARFCREDVVAVETRTKFWSSEAVFLDTSTEGGG